MSKEKKIKPGAWKAQYTLEDIKKRIEQYKKDFKDSGKRKLNQYIDEKLLEAINHEQKINMQIGGLRDAFTQLGTSIPLLRDASTKKLEKLGDIYHKMTLEQLRQDQISIRNQLNGSEEKQKIRERPKKRKRSDDDQGDDEKVVKRSRVEKSLSLEVFFSTLVKQRSLVGLANKLKIDRGTASKYLRQLNITIDQFKRFCENYESDKDVLDAIKQNAPGAFEYTFEKIKQKKIKLKLLGDIQPWKTKKDIYFYEICEYVKKNYTEGEMAKALGAKYQTIGNFFRVHTKINKYIFQDAYRNDPEQFDQDTQQFLKKTLKEICSNKDDLSRLCTLFGRENNLQKISRPRKADNTENFELNLEDFIGSKSSEILEFSIHAIKEFIKDANNIDSARDKLLKHFNCSNQLFEKFLRDKTGLTIFLVYRTSEETLRSGAGDYYHTPLKLLQSGAINYGDTLKKRQSNSMKFFYQEQDTGKNKVLGYSPLQLQALLKEISENLEDPEEQDELDEKIETSFECSVSWINTVLRPFGLTIFNLLNAKKFNPERLEANTPLNQQEPDQSLFERLKAKPYKPRLFHQGSDIELTTNQKKKNSPFNG